MDSYTLEIFTVHFAGPLKKRTGTFPKNRQGCLTIHRFLRFLRADIPLALEFLDWLKHEHRVRWGEARQLMSRIYGVERQFMEFGVPHDWLAQYEL